MTKFFQTTPLSVGLVASKTKNDGSFPSDVADVGQSALLVRALLVDKVSAAYAAYARQETRLPASRFYRVEAPSTGTIKFAKTVDGCLYVAAGHIAAALHDTSEQLKPEQRDSQASAVDAFELALKAATGKVEESPTKTDTSRYDFRPLTLFTAWPTNKGMFTSIASWWQKT